MTVMTSYLVWWLHDEELLMMRLARIQKDVRLHVGK